VVRSTPTCAIGAVTNGGQPIATRLSLVLVDLSDFLWAELSDFQPALTVLWVSEILDRLFRRFDQVGILI
jgi:hypothetical protein